MSTSSSHPRASTSGPLQPAMSQLSMATPQPRQGLLCGLGPNKDALADTKKTAMDLVTTILDVAIKVADEAAVPGLSIGLESLATILKKIQTMQTNVEGVEMLQKRVTSLVESVDELLEQSGGQPLPGGMKTRVDELITHWKDIEGRAAEIKNHGKIVRFLRGDRDAKKLSELVQEISDSIQDKIVTQGVLNIEKYVINTYQVMQQIRGLLDPLFMPKFAKMAHFDSNTVRRSCLEGTRVEVLQHVHTWITAACADSRTIPRGGIVFWLNGFGGTGKTTVAVSAAEWCEERNLLGGTFFCSRSDTECRDANLIFPTLSRQLCHRHASFKEQVEAALKEKPDVANSGLYKQFEGLILHPLEKLKGKFLRLVIVLDALDECRDSDATSIILLILAKYATRIAPFLVFIITSRPEQHITAIFEARRRDSLKDTTTPLLLHDVPLDVVVKDIKLYLNFEFGNKIGIFGVTEDWPSDDEKNKLAELSHGLFIHVATAVRFIMDKAFRNPRGRLPLLLNVQPNSATPQGFLHALYSTIVVASYEEASRELVDDIRNVLGTISLAQEPLPLSVISRLLGFKEDRVRNTLSGLHSVLHIPEDNKQPIRIIHPTFPEFLLHTPDAITFTSHQPSIAPTSLDLHPATQHWYLFSRCIDAICGALKRDMIEIRYPAMFRGEIRDLEGKVVEAVHPHVSYACRFWGVHFRDGVEGAILPSNIQFSAFVRKLLLYWLETCSILNALDKVILTLDAAQHACQALGCPFEDLAPLLADCRRFALTHLPCIHAAPLQIYHSALSFSPLGSNVRATYLQELQHHPLVCRGSPVHWIPCLDTITGHNGSTVHTVAFSSDGNRFVTGGRDNSATIWGTTTRSPISSFDGHTDWIRCAVFSPDGLYVASGSDDESICVWQVSTGELVHSLKGCAGWVVYVAYCADGRRILSTTRGGEVKLWDATDGRCLFTLDGTGSETCQVGISPDGGAIARGDGNFLRFYQMSSKPGAMVAIPSGSLTLPEKIDACVFSPDGRFIAARSRHVIQVWAWPERLLVHSVDIPESDPLWSRLAFSRDGTHIGCGTYGGSVRMWQVGTEGSRDLQGRPSGVQDLAWSPDRVQVISVSDNGVIQVWDVTPSLVLTEEQTIVEHPSPSLGPPRFALIRSGDNDIALLHLPALGTDAEHFPVHAQMPNGAPTAVLFSDITSAWDNALQAADDSFFSTRRWISLTGQQHFQLSWRPIAVSLDNSLLAYPSATDDKIVNICDLCTGMVVLTLTGRTGDACSIAFSPDNRRLAIGSQDRSVEVWDARSGTLICSHIDHHDRICAITFSPDGCIVASASGDKTVRIFDVITQRVLRALDSPREVPMHVMFATDNTHLVALDSAHWVHVWNTETGAHIREFLLTDDSSVHSFIFTPDGTNILLGGDGHASRTVTLPSTGTRTWPIYHVTRDGWVYAMRLGKTQRVCSLVPEWRITLGSDGGTLCVREAESELHAKGKVVVLDMSDCLEYIDNLDAQKAYS